MKFYFSSSNSDEAIHAKNKYIKKYNQCKIDEADIIVPIGGDGFLLKSLHDYKSFNKPFYGINYGSIGFLMNSKNNGPKSVSEKICSKRLGSPFAVDPSTRIPRDFNSSNGSPWPGKRWSSIS